MSYIQSIKSPINTNHVVYKNIDFSILTRFIIVIAILLGSEVAMTNFYGFGLYIFLIISLILSLDKHLVTKILLIVSSAGLMIYSSVTMIVLLVDGLQETSLLNIISIDNLLSRILFITIFVISTLLILKEIGLNKKNLNVESTKSNNKPDY